MTTWPNTIGSDTFIIVALRCTENSTPCALASAISRSRNSRSAATCRTAASTISPSCTGSDCLRTVVVPSAPTCSMRSVVAAGTVTDVSECRKSPSVIVATWLFVSGDQAPIECGWLRAYALTDAGARRSELPSRSTGLTALPLTAS